MKKVEVSRREIQLPGKDKKISLVHCEWRFTEAEKHEIRRTLRNETPKEVIETFIRHLEFFCNGKKDLLEQPQKIDIRATRERVLTDCMAALNHLKQIERGKMITWHRENLDAYGAGTKAADPTGDFLLAELQSAWEAVGPLEKFLKIFGKYHRAEIKKKGRPSADSDHFIRKIRDIYIEHIGKPTAYEKGAFFTIVQLSLEYIGLPFKDPSKAIKAALKSK